MRRGQRPADAHPSATGAWDAWDDAHPAAMADAGPREPAGADVGKSAGRVQDAPARDVRQSAGRVELASAAALCTQDAVRFAEQSCAAAVSKEPPVSAELRIWVQLVARAALTAELEPWQLARWILSARCRAVLEAH